MSLSLWTVRRPITTFMVFLGVMVLGIVAYRQLPVQLLPDITLPTIGVYTFSPRTADENVDRITRRIEGIAAELPRVKAIRTWTWSDGVWMRVDFEYGVDVQYALVDFEERLLSFQQSLDDRQVLINAFPFSTTDFEANYMNLSVRGRGDVEAIFATAAEQVEQQLKSLPGVANVEVSGLREDAAQIDLNTDLIASYGLDVATIIGKVQSAVGDDVFLGRLRVPGETHYVRLDDRIRTIEELADIHVDSRGIVRLKDVADIYSGRAAPQSISRYDGANAIWLTLEREAGQNLIDLARATRQRVVEINETLPSGLELRIDDDAAEYVENAISRVKQLAGIGAILALLVPLVFFRSFRVALIVFVSVPISLISVFNLFHAMGMSINIFSIIGLALGVGMLVDNAIVVVENSFRLYEEGKSPLDAAGMGGAEVGRGLFAATLTTAAVFVPMAFLDGEFRLFIREPTLALIFPLFVSLLVALSLIPVLTSLVLRSKKSRERGRMRRSRFHDGYAWLLKGALRNRPIVLFIIVVAVAHTLLEGCGRVSQSADNMEGPTDVARVYFQAPRGSTLSDVSARVVPLEERLGEHRSIDTFRVRFDTDGGNVFIRLRPIAERAQRETLQEFTAQIQDHVGGIPGLEFSLRRFDQPMAAPPVSLGNMGTVELKGLDFTILTPYAERLVEALRAHPQINNAEIREDRQDPYYLAIVDRDKSRVFDVKAEQIARYIGTTRASGTISTVQLRDGERRTNVSFIITEAEGRTIDEVRAMTMYSPGIGQVPLGELAQFQISQAPSRIRRQDRQASLEVAYYHSPDVNISQIGDDIREIYNRLPNPGGVTIEFTGEIQRLDERMSQFLFMVIFGSLLVYVVMAAVFESFWIPFIILATNPLMVIGIVWGLDFAGLPLDNMAVFGVILLIGLAVNNGIVMMDRCLSLQRRGFSRVRAVFEAALTRLRPIFMTYMTTTLGLLPLALVGQEGEQWRPVAVVVIGGLTSATILTLVVLPCFYIMGDDFVRWARRPFLNFLTVLFETLEGLTNLILHPISVIRRRIPLVPSAAPLLSALMATSKAVLVTPIKLVVSLPMDLVWIFVTLMRGGRQPAWKKRQLPGTRILKKVLVLPGVLIRLRPARHFPFVGLKPIAVPPVMESEPSELVSPSTLSLSNIQVIYPPTGIAAIRANLPARLGGKPGTGVHALKGINWSMDRGLVGLLGPNGAGKTTLLRCMAGLLEPTRGSVRLYGVSHREAPGRMAPLIGYLPQGHGQYDWMTLEQYLDYFATLTARSVERALTLETAEAGREALLSPFRTLATLDDPRSRREAIQRAVEEVNLVSELKRRVGTFSGGMRQRAALARVLLHSPPVLIVDEPTAGLDPVERVKVRALLSRLAKERLVLFSTHIIEDLEQGCDHLAILDQGALVYTGSPEALRQQLEGRVWEVLENGAGEKPPTLRNQLVESGCRILYQVVREDGQGYRVLSQKKPAAGGSGSRAVTPSLEDALLSVLKPRLGS
ncbi:MAG: efflux RND transporter permease subunit [Candidatus Sumerlaeia bacterium]|nr:efflux RND transporter permease subunit [Candidatus Sumerlaeia bacterium]